MLRVDEKIGKLRHKEQHIEALTFENSEIAAEYICLHCQDSHDSRDIVNGIGGRNAVGIKLDTMEAGHLSRPLKHESQELGNEGFSTLEILS